MYEKHFRVWMKSKHNRRGLAGSLLQCTALWYTHRCIFASDYALFQSSHLQEMVMVRRCVM